MRFLHPAARPRLTSPHRSLRVLSIIPLFVLIEYLLAYLFLITDSRPSVPRARARLVHAHPAEPLVLAAPGGLRSGRPWAWKCQSVSKYRADRLLVGQSDGFSD